MTVDALLPERRGPLRLALLGAKGMLAHQVCAAAPRSVAIAGFDLPELDITKPEQVRAALLPLRPDLIVNCAAFTAVDRCESEEAQALAVNGTAVETLASVAGECGALLVHISTDYVFDGTKSIPYREDDPVAPISAYGRSKLAGERAILSSGLERFFIIRTSWLYGSGGKNFVETIIRLAMEREELRIVADQVGCPTYTGDLATAIFRLLAPFSAQLAPHAAYGVYHFSNDGQCSWYEFACAIVATARQLGIPIKTRSIVPIRTSEYPLPAQRPTYSVFCKQKYQAATGAEVPGWQSSLQHYMQEHFLELSSIPPHSLRKSWS